MGVSGSMRSTLALALVVAMVALSAGIAGCSGEYDSGTPIPSPTVTPGVEFTLATGVAGRALAALRQENQTALRGLILPAQRTATEFATAYVSWTGQLRDCDPADPTFTADDRGGGVAVVTTFNPPCPTQGGAPVVSCTFYLAETAGQWYLDQPWIQCRS
jgi:hypothetical protein